MAIAIPTNTFSLFHNCFLFKYSVFIRTDQGKIVLYQKNEGEMKKVIFCLLFQTKCLYLLPLNNK